VPDRREIDPAAEQQIEVAHSSATRRMMHRQERDGGRQAQLARRAGGLRRDGERRDVDA
jgi:hypothetical protein